MKHLALAALAAASLQAGLILPNQAIVYDSANGGHTSTVLQTTTGSITVGAFTLANSCVVAPTCSWNPSFTAGFATMIGPTGTVGAQPDGTFRLAFVSLWFGFGSDTGAFSVEPILDPVTGRVQATYTSVQAYETPEPATWALAGLALVGIAIRRR